MRKPIMAVTVLYLLRSIAPAGAEVVFGDPLLVANGNADGAMQAAAADFDGDGDLDIVSASFLDRKVAWYENVDGHGSFGPQQVITDTTSPSSVFPADLDGDGDTDLAFTTYVDGTVAWCENTDGTGTFGPRQVITATAGGAVCVCCADIDGDGDLDVVAAAWVDDTVAWYENEDGVGGFGAGQVVTAAATGARFVRAADLDADGDPDLLVAAPGADAVIWFENADGQGGFSAPSVLDPQAPNVLGVAAADLDGDGDCDALSATSDDDTIAWYENTDGLGGFGPPQVISSVMDYAFHVATADIDGDGDTDVVSAARGADTVAWHENGGGAAPAFVTHTVSTAVDGAECAVAADLDGDGDLDLLACANEADAVMWFRSKLATAVPAGTPTGCRLHPCVPNPFNPRTTIAYELPEPALVTLRIHAPDGRLVRILVPGRPMPAGSHQAIWTGLDAAGRPAASGVYLCRLDAGPFRETRRMTLVR